MGRRLPLYLCADDMSAEAVLQGAVRLEAARRGIYLWRNNSGALPDSRGVPVRFGLGNDSPQINEVLKSSDLIGITPQGRFVAFEIKAPGWLGPRTKRERAQENFITLIKQNGGIAGFITSMEEFFLCLQS